MDASLIKETGAKFIETGKRDGGRDVPGTALRAVYERSYLKRTDVDGFYTPELNRCFAFRRSSHAPF